MTTRRKEEEEGGGFGLANAQNISSFSYPLKVSQISNLYDLTIPQKLPEVRIVDDHNDDDDDDTDTIIITKNGIIDRDWVSNILSQLDNLLKQIPTYSLPPLLNVYNDGNNNNNNKRINTCIHDIVNKNNFGNEIFSFEGNQQQQQQQQQQQKSSSSSSVQQQGGGFS